MSRIGRDASRGGLRRATVARRYCAGGELFHHLCRRRVLTPEAVRFYCAELALALQCAHDHGVVCDHRVAISAASRLILLKIV